MNLLQAMALACFRSEAQAALLSGKRSLALYDELERRIRLCRENTALVAQAWGPAWGVHHQLRVEAVDLAINLLEYRRRKYIRRMVNRLLAAPSRVPERGTG